MLNILRTAIDVMGLTRTIITMLVVVMFFISAAITLCVCSKCILNTVKYK